MTNDTKSAELLALVIAAAEGGALRRLVLSRPASGDAVRTVGRLCRFRGEAVLALEAAHADGKVFHSRLSLPLEGELPLTEEEAALLPLFCAAYVYLEDDPEKAGFYLSRFREGLLRLKEPAGARLPYRDTSRWG